MASDIILGKVDGHYDTSTFLITISPIFATLLGLWLWRPPQKMIWFLWLASWVSLGIGDALGYFKVSGYNTTPGPRDVFYLFEYLYLAGAILLLVWKREDRRDLVSMLGTFVLTIAVICVAFGRTLSDLSDANSFAFHAQALAYVLLEGAFVAMVLRLFMSSGEKPVSYWLIIVMGVLVTISAFSENEMQSVLRTGGHPDFDSPWYILFRYIPAIGLYGVGGMVALRPSMARLANYQHPEPYSWRWQLEAALATAVFVPLIVTTYHGPALAIRIFAWIGIACLIVRYWLIGYIMFSTYLWLDGKPPRRVDRVLRKIWKQEKKERDRDG
jgi:hypothetical protein